MWGMQRSWKLKAGANTPVSIAKTVNYNCKFFLTSTIVFGRDVKELEKTRQQRTQLFL
jgi:hypothetical protein